MNIPKSVTFSHFYDRFPPLEGDSEDRKATVIYWFFGDDRPKTNKEALASQRFIAYVGHLDATMIQELIEKQRKDFRATVENLVSKEPVDFLPIGDDVPASLPELLDSMVGKFV